MSLEDIAKIKRKTMQIYSTIQRYDSYKKSTKVTSNLYEHDYHFYNDSVQQRHQRNIKEFKKLISALKNKSISPEMLQFNTTNTFYPSYILNHHFSHFSKLAATLAQNYPPLRSYLKKFTQFTEIGAIFEKTINTEFKKEGLEPIIQDGVIKMGANTYFYSFKTSLYLNVCVFELKQKNKNQYVFVRLRDENGQFLKDIQTRDLGATVSSDYLAIGYRFNNVKPLFIVEGTHLFILDSNGKVFRSIVSDDAVTELGYTISDLIHSLYVTVKYTTMRQQFSTLQTSKTERPIIQYQAVVSRIADGFATLYGLSFLRQRMMLMPQVAAFIKFYLPFMHQVVLERLIELRQCCGGFGYMQISGHPGFIERVTIRSAQPTSTIVPQNNAILKRLHYYSNDFTRESEYIKQIFSQTDPLSNTFYYFVVICMRMRMNKDKIDPRVYMKQFLKQACVQMMYSNTYFQPVDNTNPFESLLPFMILKHVINNSKYLNLSPLPIKINESFHEKLIERKAKILQQIAKQIPRLTDALQVGFLRNVVVGEKDSDSFYNKVMQISKNNRRNSPEYTNQILKGIRQVLRERPKL